MVFPDFRPVTGRAILGGADRVKTIQKTIRVNRMDIVYLLGFQLGFFLVGMVMVLIINRFFNEDPDFACMGSLMGLVGAMAGLMCRGNLLGKTRCNLALSMGQTRKYALASEAICDFSLIVAALAVGRALYALEKGLYLALWPGFENDIPMEMFYRWRVLALVVPAVLVGALFITAVMMRSNKAMLVCYLAFIVCVWAFGRGMNDLEDGYGGPLATVAGWVKTAVLTVPPAGWAAIGGAAAVAMVAFTVWVYRTAEAKI